MLKPSKDVSPNTLSRVFVGYKRNGEIMVQKGNRKNDYAGSLFLLIKKSVGGHITYSRKLIHCSAGAIDKAKPTVSFRCVSESGDEILRLIGVRTASQSTDRAVETNRNSSPKLFDGHTANASAELSKQLQQLLALKRSGLDPDVRMSFISPFVGESPATLYRKMGREFPAPVKRGRGSFWALSAIEAYKAGLTCTSARDHTVTPIVVR